MAYGFSELLREQLLELYSEFFPRSVKRDGEKEKNMSWTTSFPPSLEIVWKATLFSL